MMIDERAETQEDVKFLFQAPPMFKNSRTIFLPFYNQIGSRTKNSLFQKFCSTAVDLLSSRNNLLCKVKEIRNLPQIFLE